MTVKDFVTFLMLCTLFLEGVVKLVSDHLGGCYRKVNASKWQLLNLVGREGQLAI